MILKSLHSRENPPNNELFIWCLHLFLNITALFKPSWFCCHSVFQLNSLAFTLPFQVLSINFYNIKWEIPGSFCWNPYLARQSWDGKGRYSPPATLPVLLSEIAPAGASQKRRVTTSLSPSRSIFKWLECTEKVTDF